MLKTICLAFAATFTISFAAPAMASDTVEITWTDLLPKAHSYDDPFVELDYSQIRDLADLYRIEVLNADRADQEQLAKSVELRERLASQGLDPDQLFQQREIVMKQRKLAATEPNTNLLGKNVRLPGYLLPLEMVDQKAVEFLLVPTVGACIHTPPPPANQIVLVRYEHGFDIDEVYKPVWISGEMRAQINSSSLHLVDGQADIETTYYVDALSVDEYD